MSLGFRSISAEQPLMRRSWSLLSRQSLLSFANAAADAHIRPAATIVRHMPLLPSPLDARFDIILRHLRHGSPPNGDVGRRYPSCLSFTRRRETFQMMLVAKHSEVIGPWAKLC